MMMINNNKQMQDMKKITDITLNKGMDINGIQIIDGEKFGASFGCGLSINNVINLLHQYADGNIIIEYSVHDSYKDQDIKKYEKRIAMLINSCENLEIVKTSVNKVMDGFLFPNHFVTIVNFKKGK
jgi:hypothetical protein